jgi:2-polyprenyl-3-methyl-5-hydroxy-6-metoxy-1,4-benzoquinol methylase/MoaA/NifB/PqqE/SkfB family radical SAM enzyme
LASHVIAIDSVIMHIASAFDKSLTSIFTVTPVIQTVPLHYDPIILSPDNDLTQVGISQLQLKSIKDRYKNSVLNTPEPYDKRFEGFYYNTRGNDFYKRWKFIEDKLERLGKTKDLKVLDIGCNNGYFTDKFSKISKKVVAIDINEEQIKQTRNLNLPNVETYIIEDLLEFLKNINETFDVVLYMGVHHHIYEQKSPEYADSLLNEISRLGKCMFFEMGQVEEDGGAWAIWKNLIPNMEDSRKELPQLVLNNSRYKYCELVSSTRIHGADRWLFYFSEQPEPLKEIEFNNKKYRVKLYTYGRESELPGSELVVREKPLEEFDPDIRMQTRYYIVEDDSNKLFLVKEKLFPLGGKDLLPKHAALNEYERGQVVLQHKDLKDRIAPAIAINNNFLLFDFFNWPDLRVVAKQKKMLKKEIADDIKETAKRIFNVLGEYDFNINNVLINSNGEYKFIDFEYGAQSLVERLNAFDLWMKQPREDVVNINNRLLLPQYYYRNDTYWAHMVTFRCSSSCPYCIVDGRGKHVPRNELSGKQILSWWNSIYHKKSQKLSIIGGEPTLHPDIVEIVNGLQEYDITITTNCKGEFYNNDNFEYLFDEEKIKANGSKLRINTTYHPHLMQPEKYFERVKRFKDAGHYVDQTAFVYTPEVQERYSDRLKRLEELGFKISWAPYLGFYNEEDGFRAPFCEENLKPDETYPFKDDPSRICGLTDLDAYRHLCGGSEPKQVLCNHPGKSLIISPEGYHYDCHYKLYYDIDPNGSIFKFNPVEKKLCNFGNLCNFCDVPRLGCKINETAKSLVMNKLYDRRERNNSEIRYLDYKIKEFSKKFGLEYNFLKWFEYSYFLLYSGHRHGSKVLDVGSAKSVLPYFLAHSGYDVTTLDKEDFEYRNKVGSYFGVKTLQRDLNYFHPELENKFDLITCSSVIEHIENDTKAILDMSKYLKRGGILAISSDFYREYIEYPDANRTLFPESKTDSRVYTPETFIRRIVKPLEEVNLKRQGETDFSNVDITDLEELAVRGTYTFGISILRRVS